MYLFWSFGVPAVYPELPFRRSWPSHGSGLLTVAPSRVARAWTAGGHLGLAHGRGSGPLSFAGRPRGCRRARLGFSTQAASSVMSSSVADSEAQWAMSRQALLSGPAHPRTFRRQVFGDSPHAGRDWPLGAARVDHDIAGHEVGQGEHLGSFCVVKQGQVHIDLIRLAGRRASYSSALRSALSTLSSTGLSCCPSRSSSSPQVP
jgi:hypothetical protein